MTIDCDLLRNTLQHIDIHPEQWNQADYRTCFAAHAALLGGARWVIDDDNDRCNPCYYMMRTSGDELDPRPVWDYAASLLGLDRDQQRVLFSGDNTLDDLHHHVSALTAELAPGPAPA